MKKFNLLLLVTILGSNMLGLGVNPNRIEKKFADTRAANVTQYTTTKNNRENYVITINDDSKITFTNKPLLKLSSGTTVNTGMTSLTINQTLALSTNNNYILLEKIDNKTASLIEISTLEYMFGLRNESDILFDTTEPDKVYTFSSSDPYMYTTQLIEGVSYSHTYSFSSNFVNGSTYAYDGLVGNGYYVSAHVEISTYNFLNIASTKEYDYRVFYINTSSIKMTLANGTILS